MLLQGTKTRILLHQPDRWPPDVVECVIELLMYRRAAKEYHCGTWFAYRGHPAGDPYDRNPAALWRFLMEADGVANAIEAEMYKPSGE